MHSHFNPWKTALAVVIYVVLCMVILCFSPQDYAANAHILPNAPAVVAHFEASAS